MRKFKGLLKKGYAFGKRHIAPHLKEIGCNVLADMFEGRNMGQSLKTHARQAALNSLHGQGRRR